MSEQRKVSTKRYWLWGIVGAAVLVIGVGAITAVSLGLFSGAADEAVRNEPTVVAAPTPEPSVEPVPEVPVPESVFDIPETQQMAYSPVWNPPDQGEYFWQIVDPANGYPENGGTDYVLAHACESQTCAGDELRKLVVGDHVTYKGGTYRIDEKLSIMKTEIVDQDIWSHDPARLVVITCIIEGSWQDSDKNEIVIATRVA